MPWWVYFSDLGHVPRDAVNLVEGNSHCKFNDTTKSPRISLEHIIFHINVTVDDVGDVDHNGDDDHDDAVDDDDGPIVRISSIELQLAFIVELALSTTR